VDVDVDRHEADAVLSDEPREWLVDLRDHFDPRRLHPLQVARVIGDAVASVSAR